MSLGQAVVSVLASCFGWLGSMNNRTSQFATSLCESTQHKKSCAWDFYKKVKVASVKVTILFVVCNLVPEI